MTISEFLQSIINGSGGFKSYEDREILVSKDRDIEIAGFVVRCLANTSCEGSEEVLEAIIEQRNKNRKNQLKKMPVFKHNSDDA